MNAEKLGFPVPERTTRFYHEMKARWESPEFCCSPKGSNRTKAMFELYANETPQKRIAYSTAYMLEHETPQVYGNELLVGIKCQAEPWPDSERKLWEDFDYHGISKKQAEKEMPELITLTGIDDPDNSGKYWLSTFHCAGGHIGWHWDWLIAGGVEGLLERIKAARPGLDEKGKEVVDCMAIALKGLLAWNGRYLDALREKLAETSDPEIKAQIKANIEMCSRVPRFGARNFREAVQTFYLSYLAAFMELPLGGNGPGRFDYYLWPYLEKDLETGETSLEEAREIIDELFIRLQARFKNHDGYVETIVVAGTAPDGSCAYNPLSKIVVESICGLNITHPSVYVRIPENAPRELLELAAKYLRDGSNRAQILNDKSIIKAIVKGGIPEEDARMYMCGGCMEISPHGMNGDLLFTGFFNTAKVLELIMNGGVCMQTGKNLIPKLNGKTLADYTSFEELYRDFESELRRILFMTFKYMDITRKNFVEFRPPYFISSMVENCIERGRIINDGGAKYEDYGSTPLGIPNIGDSLYSLKLAVFGKNAFISGKDMLEALRSDFKDNEPLRKRLLNLPKYGQGNSEADATVKRVVQDVCGIYGEYTNDLGGRVKPMIMTFRMAPITGHALAATPDGRKAGTPIAQGVTPQSSSMKDGITTAMRSATNIELWRFSGGVSNMWDLAPDAATEDNLEHLLRVFFDLGGQMYQGNTTSTEELLKAKENPEQYQNLIVRVGGYSGRFVNLCPEVQEEVIERYRHQA